MSPRRIAFWMLATAGVAVGHIAGYAAAHPDAAAREAALGGHAYLSSAASVVIPMGVLTALVWAVHTARALGLSGQIQARHLAAAQIGVFVFQEIGERVVNGDGALSAAGERGVWFGLVAQLLVAIVVTRAVDLVRRVVRHVIAGTSRRSFGMARLPALAPSSDGGFRAVVATVAVGLRAPPVVGQFR